MRKPEKPNFELSASTRAIHKSSLHFSFTRQHLDSISDYPTQSIAKQLWGVLKKAALTASSEEKGDPLNSLASLCYKQEQLLQIIRFWGVAACQDKRCSSSGSAITPIYRCECVCVCVKAISKVIRSSGKYGECKGRGRGSVCGFLYLYTRPVLNASDSESQTSQTSWVTSYMRMDEQGQRHLWQMNYYKKWKGH